MSTFKCAVPKKIYQLKSESGHGLIGVIIGFEIFLLIVLPLIFGYMHYVILSTIAEDLRVNAEAAAYALILEMNEVSLGQAQAPEADDYTIAFKAHLKETLAPERFENMTSIQATTESGKLYINYTYHYVIPVILTEKNLYGNQTYDVPMNY